MSNPTENLDTPSYVFNSPWQQYLGVANPQDAAFCTPSYPGNTGAVPSPPANGYANISTYNCAGGGTQCTYGTVATGIPAIWETPFVAAVDNWWAALIAWAAGNTLPTAPFSQIGYVRFGFSIGSEASIDCTQYLEDADGGASDSAMKTTWLAAYANAASYVLGQIAAQPTRPPWVPMMTVNMGTSLTTYAGGTDPSWSIGEAQILLGNQPFGIGTQGLENGQLIPSGLIVSDPMYIQNGPSCSGSGTTLCCSDNWCNTRPMVIGRVPVIELQDCNLSTAGGGGTGCLNSATSGTAPSGDAAPTLSQVFILSSQHGTTSAEIYYADLECALGLLPSTCPSTGPNPPQPAYLAAILALAAGQPSGTSAMTGSAHLLGSATMF